MNKFKRTRVEGINDEQIKDALSSCQSVVDGFNQLLADMPASMQLTTTELTSFVTGSENIRTFATKQQVAKNPAPAGMQPSKWEEMIYLPSEIEDYINSVYSFSRRVKHLLTSSSFPIFKIDDLIKFESGKFVLADTANDLILKRFGLYIENAKENSAIIVAEELAKNLQQLEMLLGNRSFDVIRRVVSVTYEREFSANKKYILSHLRR